MWSYNTCDWSKKKGTFMSLNKFTDEQIIPMLRQVEVEIAKGWLIEERCRELAIR
jgi:hypothetical protein